MCERELVRKEIEAEADEMLDEATEFAAYLTEQERHRSSREDSFGDVPGFDLPQLYQL